MNRRRVLGLATMGAVGTAFSGGAMGEKTPSSLTHMARVRVSADRVIRTVVGLRPYRSSGFVVRRENLGEKIVVHNYGHGGGGMSLSWGTAQLALELALETGRDRFAVLGCGGVGLATARLLQDEGFPVTIYARDLPPETTSNISGAQWSPVSVFEPEKTTPEFRAQFVRASRLAYRYFQNLVGDYYGVHWVENYALTDEAGHNAMAYNTRLGIGDLYPGVQELLLGSHPFPYRYAERFLTMFIEPPVYLNAVLRDFLLRGGKVQVRSFADPRDVQSLEEPVVINCTGLGARTLFGDEALVPIKGQLSVLLPQPEIDYLVLAPGPLYMFPRRDGILLGGTFEEGVYSLEPNPQAQTRILAGHAHLFASNG